MFTYDLQIYSTVSVTEVCRVTNYIPSGARSHPEHHPGMRMKYTGKKSSEH